MAKKYELSFRDVDYVPHRLEIYDDDYVGSVDDTLTGKVFYSANVRSLFDPIQGSSLRVELDATSSKSFSDIALSEERQFRVVYSIDNNYKFIGWINPEGWWESLNDEQWVVSFDVVDGLGYLDGLSYVQSDGLFWTGKQTALDIIINTLGRSGLEMDVKMDINIYYGLVSSGNVLSLAKFNAERFYQDDEEPMSCYDALRTTLEVFGACIRQREGEWYIFRPQQLFSIPDTGAFWHYDYQGVAQSPQTPTVDLTDTAGSEGSGTYSKVYVNRNHRLTTTRGLGGFSMKYSYGAANSLIGANKYLYTADGLTYDDWTINSSTNLTIPPAGGQGVEIDAISTAPIKQMTSDSVALAADDIIEAAISAYTEVDEERFFVTMNFRVVLDDTGTLYYLKRGGSWSTTASTIEQPLLGTSATNLRIMSDPLPASGNLTVEIWTAEGDGSTAPDPSPDPPYTGSLFITSVEVINGADEVSDIKGEIHTAQRTTSPTSKIEDPEEVFVGDNLEDTYVGAIYEADGSTNTSVWHRAGDPEDKSLLQIACEERLRAEASTRYIFSGSIKGYFEYLSVFTLEGVTGKYVPIKYNYNAMSNVVEVEMQQIIYEDISDIEYTKTLDRGKVIKPKIKG